MTAQRNGVGLDYFTALVCHHANVWENTSIKITNGKCHQGCSRFRLAYVEKFRVTLCYFYFMAVKFSTKRLDCYLETVTLSVQTCLPGVEFSIYSASSHGNWYNYSIQIWMVATAWQAYFIITTPVLHLHKLAGVYCLHFAVGVCSSHAMVLFICG